MQTTVMGAKLLIVEDDPDTLLGLSIRLESCGFSVLEAMDAASAVCQAREEAPDLIVLDLGLPDEDGYAFMEKLKSFPETAAIPVIVLTAREADENQERSYSVGAYDFFQKPVNQKWFLTSIERALAVRFLKKQGDIAN
jgi:CheY-like chemotaxis protein